MSKSVVNQLTADIKNIQHDIFLLYLIPIPVFLATIFPFVFNQIALFFGEILEIQQYYMLFVSYIFLILPPMLWGTIFGFLIINEKDLHTLSAIRVTPTGLQRLVYYRITTGIILSSLTGFIVFIILGFALSPQLVFLIVISGVFSPFMMFGIAILAKNKVQAFALMKGLSSFFVLPFFYLLVPSIELVFAIVPPYWIVKPLINDFLGSTTSPVLFVGALISQIIWLIVLERLFHRSLNK